MERWYHQRMRGPYLLHRTGNVKEERETTMAKARYLLGLYGGKAARVGLKLLKRQGSYMPGKISDRLDPNYLENLPKPKRILAVTGTNGKTTTSNMILDVLSGLEPAVVNNSLGSNTKYGILAALSENVDLAGRKRSDLAVLEVDERWTPVVFQSVLPDILIITNLYQDSYKRNAHTDFIRDTIQQGLPKGTKLVQNADCLISSQIGEDHERVFFSIAPQPGEKEIRDSRLKDIRYCPKCGTELVWDFVRYHHLGRAHCPSCGFSNQQAKYTVTKVDGKTRKIHVAEQGREVLLPLILGTTEAVYNQLAAYAGLREFGLSEETITAAMAKIKVVSSRFDKVTVGDTTVYTISAKGFNPIANSRVFDSIRKHPRPKTVIYANDDEPGGRYRENLSWLYDTDFQYLAGEDVTRFIINSWRAGDVVVRALMAGVPEEKIRSLDNYRRVAELVDLEEPGDVFILHDIGESNIKEAKYIRDRIVKRLEEVK